MAEAINLNTQPDLPKKLSDAPVSENTETLHDAALHHYELSLHPNTRNEQTVAHRGLAKKYANLLRAHPEYKATAINLLARIALDEGFYKLAEHLLKDALTTAPDDAGCWYSLGHTYLALKHPSKALDCFTRSMDISPNETRAIISIAHTLTTMGRVVDAFQMYRQLIQMHPADKPIQEKLFEVVSHIKADYYQEDLEQDVLDWLGLIDVDHQALANLVMSLLTHKYNLDDPDAVIDIQDLAHDELLLRSLDKIFFTEKSQENFLCLVRKQVLLNSITSDYQDMGLLKLAGQLAVYGEHNEHVYVYDEDERNIVNSLHDLLAKSALDFSKDAQEIAHLITLYGMYESIETLFTHQPIEVINRMSLPDFASDLFQLAVVARRQENLIAEQIMQLDDIRDKTSRKVKEQYESNPYPRWLHLGYNTPTNYGRALENELIGYRAPEFFNMGTIKVLIAGAGTGKHALRVARYFRNVEVLAIDLSKRSLAYAQQQALNYNIKNINFLCADILDLSSLKERFHIIECSGVLHHMKDPEPGLSTLTALLRPQGLIKIGLYSRQARKAVRELRALMDKFKVPCNLDSVRTIRQSILKGDLPFDFTGILSSQDFYSYSGCRDLLFHVQERQYDPIEIQDWLIKEQLEFLGFILPAETKLSYQRLFPQDQRMLNLENWQRFEQQSPATFAGMYQFYAQIKGARPKGLC